MPNIKSAKKRVLIAKVNNERNKADKSALKTTLKKFEAAVTDGNREQADSAYQAAVQSIDKAAGKGILHKNAAARKKSQVTLKMNKLALCRMLRNKCPSELSSGGFFAPIFKNKLAPAGGDTI